MAGWMRWKGRKVFLKLNCGRNYSGEIIFVEETGSGDSLLTWLILIDKKGMENQFNTEEIAFIQEEH